MLDHKGNTLKCEVCKLEDAVGVASVPGIPYSAAYGSECLRQGADPFDIVRANILCCGGDAYVADWVLDGMTFASGKYMSVRNAMEMFPLTKEELDF